MVYKLLFHFSEMQSQPLSEADFFELFGPDNELDYEPAHSDDPEYNPAYSDNQLSNPAYSDDQLSNPTYSGHGVGYNPVCVGHKHSFRNYADDRMTESLNKVSEVYENFINNILHLIIMNRTPPVYIEEYVFNEEYVEFQEKLQVMYDDINTELNRFDRRLWLMDDVRFFQNVLDQMFRYIELLESRKLNSTYLSQQWNCNGGT